MSYSTQKKIIGTQGDLVVRSNIGNTRGRLRREVIRLVELMIAGKIAQGK